MNKMKMLNKVGLTVFALGALALAGFGFYKATCAFWVDAKIPMIIKAGVTALLLGIIIILISLIFERIRDSKKEKNDYNNN